VSVALKEYPDLQVYAIAGESQPWGEHAVHSQGLVTGSRASFIDGELERIEKYTDKGDLVAAAEVWAYMEQRDAVV